MRTSVAFVLLVAISVLLASEPADRADIEHLIGALNDPHATDLDRANLFTTDSQNELGRLADVDRRMVHGAGEPWSEVTTPRFVIQSIRFITADVAVVDAENTQYGSVVLAVKVPVLFVVKRETGGWRIAAMRILLNLKDLQ
jgi:hypothetical protein